MTKRPPGIVPANPKFRYDEDGRAICGAVTRAGKPCPNAPMENGRCRVHGGASKSGINHYNFKHGKYSKYLPSGMVDTVESLVRDPDYVRLREQIAILDVMTFDALQEWAAGGGGDMWKQLKARKDEYYRARALSDAKKMVAITMEIMEIIEAGYAKMAASKEVRETLEQRRKLTESERRLMVEERTMVPAPMVVALLRKIGESLARNVQSDAERSAVIAEVQEAMGTLQQRQTEYHRRTINDDDPLNQDYGFEA